MIPIDRKACRFRDSTTWGIFKAMVELMSTDHIVVLISTVIDWADIDRRVDDKIRTACLCG
ncbi:Uncharacterised protein [Vibrio cholerae]|uniref:Uncharacterized protein n=1 Tax=Vibrio cholerae TaxID=666 RepID=A0A655WEJ2_VIBCL|nr:Uncharacterised protein [Vibrio cholerae]CSC94287.1 Uncharacterised protein [Vibrio cholerae]CSI30470.1 Uncharacterised protein [Vibrio cholerae]